MKVNEKLYANQFVPLWEDCTIVEKIKGESKGSSLSGGSISHVSCGEKLTPKQTKHLLDLMMENGLEHCAINPCYTTCSHGHTTYGKNEVCPVCGEKRNKDTVYYSRVCGFFVPLHSWNSIKREYDFERRHYQESVGL